MTSNLVGSFNLYIIRRVQIKFLGGSKYFVSFVDDFSRYAYVCFVNDKSDVFSVFKDFKACVTNQSGQVTGELRTDGGGEYKMNLRNICDSRVFSIKSRQQNAMADRFNRTVCELARALGIHTEWPK